MQRKYKPTDVYLLDGVLVYPGEMGLKGIPLDALYKLFYHDKEAGQPLVDSDFATSFSKPYSQTLDWAVYLLGEVYRDYHGSRRGRMLRNLDIGHCLFFQEAEINNYSSEFIEQLMNLAEFITASKMVFLPTLRFLMKVLFFLGDPDKMMIPGLVHDSSTEEAEQTCEDDD